MANPESWSEYYQATLDKPLHPIFEHLDPFLKPGLTALELGCGVGNGVLHLVEKGLNVLAVDADKEAIDIVFERVPGSANVALLQSTFQDLTLPAKTYDVIVAGFSLFFMPRPDFDAFWPRMVAALKPGGVVGGQLLGVNDDWRERGYAVHSRDEVDAMLSPFEVVYFEEAERDGTTVVGEKKHWHVFHVVAKLKQSLLSS
jgi:tellurite methyltransferase